jgi:phosphoenolpyruvate-protein phosphotransferase
MKVFKGVPAAEGYAVAPLSLLKQVDALSKIPSECRARSVEEERSRLERALSSTLAYFESFRCSLPQSEQELIAALEEIAKAIVSEALEEVSSSGVCAELAVKRVYERYAELFKTSGSSLIALRADDLRSLASTLVEELAGSGAEARSFEGMIVAAEELGPRELFRLIEQRVKGIVTVRGGVTSHVAIVARGCGLPYIIVPNLDLSAINEGDVAVLDAMSGLLIVNPSGEVLDSYRKKVSAYLDLKKVFNEAARAPALTRDGARVEVLCNVGDLEEARYASTVGCEGVGLFRVEFMYIKDRPPSEEVLAEAFTRVAEFFRGKPVVIRAPDLGADKPLPYLKLREDNPYLGVRGVRLLLEYRAELFKPFLRAFLRAYSKHGNLKLMVPMVSRCSEIYETAQLLEEAAQELGVKAPPKIGAMVETPAAALMVDKLAETGLLEFVSYGTNDLTQYVLAVDRGNPKLAHAYDELDPSVVRLLASSVRTALSKGLHVEVCGEMASKVDCVPVLLGAGIRSLSVNVTAVGMVKHLVRSLEVPELERLLNELLQMSDPKSVREAVKKHLAERAPWANLWIS